MISVYVGYLALVFNAYAHAIWGLLFCVGVVAWGSSWSLVRDVLRACSLHVSVPYFAYFAYSMVYSSYNMLPICPCGAYLSIIYRMIAARTQL